MNGPGDRQAFVIAIDGPSGTGKSTVARRVASSLRAGYLDTGAMYRIVTLAVLTAGVDPDDDEAVANLLPQLHFSSPIDPVAQHHELAGADVSVAIRNPDVTAAVSPVSANPAVRAWLKGRQQELARSGRMVVEGRDIGTVIAPNATLKVFLTAAEQVRASRRHNDVGLSHPAHSADLDTVRASLARRDAYDSSRKHAPLVAAQDAIVLDSSHLEIGQTVEAVLTLAAERGIR
jgi:CMP/dCMP kinase